MPPSLPLTLIVASTPSHGIGHGGALPWPALKAELAYFARVTKRAPPRAVNAVLMGRRTWDSIPLRFRPLRGRVNVVVSSTLRLGRAAGEGGTGEAGEGETGAEGEKGAEGTGEAGARVTWVPGKDGQHDGTGVLSASSVREAVAVLGAWAAASSAAAAPSSSTEAAAAPSSSPEAAAGPHDPPPKTPPPALNLHRVFVIGGATLYDAALAMPATARILRTRIQREYACDVHFPVALGEAAGWRRASAEALDAWVGEAVPRGSMEEGGVRWEFEMWVRAE